MTDLDQMQRSKATLYKREHACFKQEMVSQIGNLYLYGYNTFAL